MSSLSDLFEPALVTELQEQSQSFVFSEGDVIIDYGKYIRFMPLILRGTVKVLHLDEEGREILLYYLSENETCSMAYSCCMEARKSVVKAIAEEETEMLAVPFDKLNDWICQYPSWKKFIFRSFNMRFMELLKSIESVAFHKLDERLIQYLQEKRKHSAGPQLHISHSQIAEELATSRVVVSRLMKQLENEGRIQLSRNEIRLLDA